MSERFIRYLLENYYDVQKLRKATYNRIVAYVKENKDRFSEHVGENPKSYSRAYAKVADRLASGKIPVSDEDKALRDIVWFFNMLHDTEKGLAKRLGRWSETHPIRANYLDDVYGIGPIFSSGLIAWLQHIILSSECDTVSKLWAYCGLSAIHWENECADGHKTITTSAPGACPVKIKKKGGRKEEREPCGAEITKSVLVHSPPKRKRGYLLMINARLKTFCWKIAASFEKQNAKKSKYRRVYVKKKAEYLNRPDLREPIEKKVRGAKLHVRLMAMRYTVKRFLANLWSFWRETEGLPVTKPYAVDILGHANDEAT